MSIDGSKKNDGKVKATGSASRVRSVSLALLFKKCKSIVGQKNTHLFCERLSQAPLFAFGALGIYVAIPLVTQLVLYNPWQIVQISKPTLIALIYLNISLIMGLICFAVTSLSDPGIISNKPDVIIDVRSNYNVVRWCTNCDSEKSPRSHHCNVCKRCVAVYDHHCPWINNCVGYRNVGNFLRLLFWTTSSVVACITLVVIRILEILEHDRQFNSMTYMGPYSVIRYPYDYELYTICILSLILFILIIVMTILTCTQFYYAGKNMSTVERLELSTVGKLVNDRKIDPKLAEYPYDLGIVRNFKSYLGPIPLLWFIPCKRHGSLRSFEMSRNFPENYLWPPKAYLDYKAQVSGLRSEIRRIKIDKKNHIPRFSPRIDKQEKDPDVLANKSETISNKEHPQPSSDSSSSSRSAILEVYNEQGNYEEDSELDPDTDNLPNYNLDYEEQVSLSVITRKLANVSPRS